MEGRRIDFLIKKHFPDFVMDLDLNHNKKDK
jgi:hypothetical protein